LQVKGKVLADLLNLVGIRATQPTSRLKQELMQAQKSILKRQQMHKQIKRVMKTTSRPSSARAKINQAIEIEAAIQSDTRGNSNDDGGNNDTTEEDFVINNEQIAETGAATSDSLEHEMLIGELASKEKKVLRSFIRELERSKRGGFKLLFPKENFFNYRQFFEAERPLNVLLAKYMFICSEKEKLSATATATVAAAAAVVDNSAASAAAASSNAQVMSGAAPSKTKSRLLERTLQSDFEGKWARAMGKSVKVS